MNYREAFAKVVEGSTLSKYKLAEALGIHRASLTTVMKQKSMSVDRLIRYIAPMNWKVVLVPEEQVRFLPKEAIVLEESADE